MLSGKPEKNKTIIYAVILGVVAVIFLAVIFRGKIFFSKGSFIVGGQQSAAKINVLNKKTSGIKNINTCLFDQGCESNDFFKSFKEYDFNLLDVKKYKVGNSQPFSAPKSVVNINAPAEANR